MMSSYLPPIVLTETSKAEKQLLARLDSIPLTRMYQASFRAVVRLHLFFTGRTHELFKDFSDRAGALIVKKAGKDQVLDGSAGFDVQSQLFTMWGDVFAQWSREFEQLRVEAASIPFGVLAVAHERLVRAAVSDQRLAVSEELRAKSQELIAESVEDGVFSPQLSVLLNAASEHLYGDSLNLSARIWRIDREARDGIAQVILQGVANGDSAWDVAQALEQFLGASEDCPRWTSTRLYGKTKTQIAQGDTAGLMASPCDGRGVAYNALRLARTEIQKAHALATDRILASQPWVEQEQVNLSAAHPEPDICDEVVTQGEEGKGIYPVGTIELPLHPNCLCYKTAVLMPEKEFTAQLRGWLTGEQAWTEMDRYAELVSGARGQGSGEALGVSLLPNAINLAVWLFGEESQLSAFGG
jgi:hypothetical protein